MTWDDAFEAAKYLPVNGESVEPCPDHPRHAMLRHSDGELKCTSNLHLPTVRDDVDRIAAALAEAEDTTASGLRKAKA